MGNIMISSGGGELIDLTSDQGTYSVDMANPNATWVAITNGPIVKDISMVILALDEPISLEKDMMINIKCREFETSANAARVISTNNEMQISIYAYTSLIDGTTKYSDYTAGTLLYSDIVKLKCIRGNYSSGMFNAISLNTGNVAVTLIAPVSIDSVYGFFYKCTRDDTSQFDIYGTRLSLTNTYANATESNVRELD